MDFSGDLLAEILTLVVDYRKATTSSPSSLRFIKIEVEHTPNQTDRQKYQQVMPIFQRFYYALCEVYDELAQVGG